MFSVAAVILLLRVTVVVLVDLFRVRLLNVVVPVSATFPEPVRLMVPVCALNEPLFIQLPRSVWLKDPAFNVDDAPTVKSPFTVIAAAGVALLVPPVDRLL